MITNATGVQKISGKFYRPTEMRGLSTDTKPAERIANGSVFIEMDTGKLYFFDLDNSEWLEWGET